MKTSVVSVVIVVLFAIVLVALLTPFGGTTCNGTPCVPIGPFNKTGPPSGAPPAGGGPASQVTLQILFPGSITYTDGSSQAISSSKAVIGSNTVVTNNKQISRATIAVQIYVQSTTPVSVKVTGYITESASRPSSDPRGSYYNVASNVSISQTITTANQAVTLVNVTRQASDFQSMSDIGQKGNVTNFNYNFAGSLGFNLGSPVNKSVSSIFAWPNLAIGISMPGPPPPPGSPPPPPPPPGGGSYYPGCGFRFVCTTIISPPQDVRTSWYVLGTFPAFTVASSSNGKSILSRLGIL
jgi:hypothetical protein